MFFCKCKKEAKMALDVHKLIAAINPDVYCESSVKSEVKSIVKKSLAEGKGYAEAAEIAKSKKSEIDDINKLEMENPFKLKALKNPLERRFLSYNAFGESLEPIYFWLLDTIDKDYSDVLEISKLIDNFAASPGSGYFSEMGMKATKMQEEGMKMLSSANQVLKSILNLIYDLKEFRMRIGIYEQYKKSKNGNEKQAALLSLKQIWMDTVDMKRGNTALKLMAQNYDYVMIIDAFMATNSVEDISKPADKGGLDLNDRVKRILMQRVQEFFYWVDESEKELKKRYEIEKIYLKSQVNSIKLYARWAKPYLKAAQQLEQRMNPSAALVNAFNSSIFELTLFVQGEYNPLKDISKGDLPEMFKTLKTRDYRTILIVDLNFRSSPERTQQGYGFKGRVEISFTSYSLNDDEIKILKEEIEKDDLGDTLKLIEGATDESLAKIQDEIDSILNEKKEEKNSGNNSEENPFSALFSFLKSKKKEKNENKEKIEPDSSAEKVIRNQAVLKARKLCSKMYNLYKSAHGMPTI